MLVTTPAPENRRLQRLHLHPMVPAPDFLRNLEERCFANAVKRNKKKQNEITLISNNLRHMLRGRAGEANEILPKSHFSIDFNRFNNARLRRRFAR